VGGKECTTLVQVVRYNDNGDSSTNSSTILKLSPITGRTHQLRVHTSALGLPILGDSLYVFCSTFWSSSFLVCDLSLSLSLNLLLPGYTHSPTPQASNHHSYPSMNHQSTMLTLLVTLQVRPRERAGTGPRGAEAARTRHLFHPPRDGGEYHTEIQVSVCRGSSSVRVEVLFCFLVELKLSAPLDDDGGSASTSVAN
jgi:hypothetical protein